MTGPMYVSPFLPGFHQKHSIPLAQPATSHIHEQYLCQLRDSKTVVKKSLTEREFQIDFYSHVVHEERMVCSSRYDANFDAILWIPVQELIIDKHLVTHASPRCENWATAPEGTKWYSILIWIRKKRVRAIRTWIRKKASTSTQLFTEYRREN